MHATHLQRCIGLLHISWCGRKTNRTLHAGVAGRRAVSFILARYAHTHTLAAHLPVLVVSFEQVFLGPMHFQAAKSVHTTYNTLLCICDMLELSRSPRAYRARIRSMLKKVMLMVVWRWLLAGASAGNTTQTRTLCLAETSNMLQRCVCVCV